jgi:hypothetical protein
VLLNSAYTFGGLNTDLYTVMLHEFGHVFGLGDSSDPNSVMFGKYNQPKHGLAPSDIAAIQSLYGVRTLDPHEGANGNGTPQSATPIAVSPNLDASLPVVVYGDIAAPRDVDYFSMQAPSGYEGSVTFRVQTAGISLLEPRLTIYDAAGNTLSTAQSTNLFGDVLNVQLNSLAPHAVYYVKVEGIGNTFFAVGRYGLAVTFDAESELSDQALSAVLSGPYDSLSPAALASILRDPSTALVGDDGSAEDHTGSPQILQTSAGYGPNSHYAFIGSLTNASAQDYFLVSAPANGSASTLTMTVALSAFAVHGVLPRVEILDASFNPVPAQVLVNGNGTFTIQATHLTPGATYYLRVGGSELEIEDGGNYSLVVDFHAPATLMTSFTAGNLSAATPQQANTLYVAESQLFLFAFSAGSSNGAGRGNTHRGNSDNGGDGTHFGSADQDGSDWGHRASADAGGEGDGSGGANQGPGQVQMTITDATGNVVFSLIANAGDTVGGTALFLAPGQYTITFTAIASAGSPLTYELYGTTLSDPIGPVLNDPTLKPMYVNPADPTSYYYPNNAVSKVAYLLAPLAF